MIENKNIKTLRIMIAGGGTGGHIFPAIAIANAIKKIKPETQFLFVGANGKMEMEKVPQAGYDIIGIDIAGYNRSSILKNIGLPIKIFKSFYQVSKIFKSFIPDAVIGVGGYSTYPVLKFAQAKNIPTFIHESNSFAGKSNILLGKRAAKIFTASENMEQFFEAKKIMITGNPVRQNISQSIISKKEALAFFNLNENKKTVLVVGGSLGAKSINEAIASHLNIFNQNNFQLIWQTGKPYFETASDIVKGHSNIYMNSFITNMENAYTAADVIISRSGAMAVSEICIVGKPVIFVPYPHAAEDHQTANAMALVNKNAALMVKDKDVDKDLINTLKKLIDNESLQTELSNNIKKLSVKNADEMVALQILQTINKA